MRWLPALLVCFLIPSGLAHGGDAKELVVEAHDDDGFYFTVEGYAGRNPTIVLEPNAEYHVTFHNRGEVPHNLRVHEAASHGTALIDGGNSTQFEFIVPTSGLSAYWCDPHRDLGMEGRVVASEDALEESPGVGLIALLGVIAAATVLRRR